ncbi:ABC transporter ATP-binding protein [Gulosibacter faecalis]|jgi:putative ABC transport system ATP-binding protein|uniref:ABC transporter ATP-binding protein n=1 Tax=Gulosibacter faecalis TaxID=272240 RepID=A0ABW5UTF8_9MICO|nr:ABC transporter ATP-binding protein [Gulosibacter faecalis]
MRATAAAGGTPPAPDAAAVLEVRDVTREVPLPSGETLRILRGVDLRVLPGERVAVLGRSGAGKTTLLNLLGLIDQPTSGSVVFRGQDAARLSANRLARLRGRAVGFVFQQFNLLENRTALENVMMPLLYGAPAQFWRRRQLALAALSKVGLADRADQLPRQLSGGEQQRVAIARAIVREPAVVLADEPTGALDVGTGHDIMGVLASLSESTGAALITITHDLQVAALAERIFVLQDGLLHERTLADAERMLMAEAVRR